MHENRTLMSQNLGQNLDFPAHVNRASTTAFKAKSFIATQQPSEVLICFSHLRWNFVYQRPQHLMTRFASQYKVLYVEEHVYIDEHRSYVAVEEVKNDIFVLVPHISTIHDKNTQNAILFDLLQDFLEKNNYYTSIKWYLTPMMLQWSKPMLCNITIYDCMDELSAFKYAPSELKQLEEELIQQADLVFTGGASLYKIKSACHNDTHLFPSSVDVDHFLTSRGSLDAPIDQKYISGPRIGFYGVLDERLDIKLLKALALCKSDWNFIIIGPVVKIDINDLPQLPNIHYLGAKTYEELPYYLSGWDVAFIPFAINESTKFISPTKTPEYLAAGRPVVSTPIADIVSTYQDCEIVHIVDAADLPAFIQGIERALEDSKDKQKIYQAAESVLQNMSWDKTFLDMHNLILAKQQKEANNVE